MMGARILDIQKLVKSEKRRTIAKNIYFMSKTREQFHDEVEQVLDVVRQGLAFHNGNIELVDADPVTGRVEVRFQGSCVGCAYSDMTFTSGIEEVLYDMVPEVKEVVLAAPQVPIVEGGSTT